MKPSDELFKLIRSLSKSEKRFFKLSSSLQAGEKNYLKLFDSIEKQKEYNEEEIKEQFKQETFIQHLPSEKNHLYKLILKSLRIYNADNSINSQLQDYIKNIEILYEKALYGECSKILSKGKRVAYENEKFYYLFELIKWEKTLLEEEYHSGNFSRDLNELITEEQDVIEKLRNLAEYQILYSKINYVFRIGGYVRNDDEKKMVEEISNHYLIKGKNTALSRRAAATCYYVKGLCAITNHEIEDSFAFFSKVVNIFEEHTALIQDIPKQYIKSLRNLLYYYLSVNNLDAYSDILSKMRLLQDRPGFTSTDIKLHIFTSTYNSELQVYIASGEFQKGLALIPQIMEGIEMYADKITKEDEILFYYNISYCYFGDKQFKNSLHWLNKVLNDNESSLRQDIYSIARLFNLIIHFELGNFDLLDYIVKSTSRYFQKRKSMLNREYRFEIIMLKYLNRLAKSAIRQDSLSIHFVEMEAAIFEVLEDDYEKIALEYFDFLGWAESKRSAKSFAEVKQEKFKLVLA